MSFFGSLKKISIKKVVATVKKTVSDATKIGTAVATGGIAGGLQAVGSLSKAPTALTPSTVYGSDAAAQAAGAVNTAPAAGQGSSMTPLLVAGGLLLLLILLSKGRG